VKKTLPAAPIKSNNNAYIIRNIILPFVSFSIEHDDLFPIKAYNGQNPIIAKIHMIIAAIKNTVCQSPPTQKNAINNSTIEIVS
jgi:hypothetical protein